MTLPAQFPVHDWELCFDERTYDKGMDYALDGRVSNLAALDSSGCHWSATVRGSHRTSYRCSAKLTPGEGRTKPRLVSSCSCPVGSACKHVVAMLSDAQWQVAGAIASADAASMPEPHAAAPRSSTTSIHDLARAPNHAPTAFAPPAEPDPLRSWKDWLAATDVPSASPEVAEHVALLVRSSGYGDPPDLLAALVHYRIGKRGQPIAPKNIASALHQPFPAPAGGWDDDDATAALMLVERHTARVGPLFYTCIRGRALERAFERLLQRFPVYQESLAQPLQVGSRRTLQMRWIERSDGSQRLTCTDAEGRQPPLLRGEELWYLDADQREIGRIAGGREIFERVRRAPPLAAEHSQALRELLRAHAGDLPLPAQRKPPRRIQTRPTPVLRMHHLRPRGTHVYTLDPEVPIALAVLSFEYAGIRVLPGIRGNSVRTMSGEELLEIVRDDVGELAWLEHLTQHGLRPVSALGWPWSNAFSDEAPGAWMRVDGKPARVQPATAWHDMLRALASAGVILEYEPGFPKPLREIDAGALDVELTESGQQWFDLSLGVDIEGQRMDLLPILRSALADPRFPLVARKDEAADASWRVEIDDERALRLPLATLRRLITPLLEWLQGEGAVRLHRSQGALVDAFAGSMHWRGNETLRRRLLDLSKRPPATDPPKDFHATLRPYQREGLAWLNLLGEAGLGGILADDMGLGKTVQVLAHLLSEGQRRGQPLRTLVVAPTSLMGNWREEAERFAPALRPLILQGPDRGDRYQDITEHDLVLTTYPLLARDRERLLEHDFDLLVLDEAQAIKNARSVAAQVVREIRAQRRLAMTGTPLENHLGELWAQFDAVEPGLLGNDRSFTRLYRTPIEKHGDTDRQLRLNRRIAPLLLRRRKDEVLRDLPPKTEIVRHLDLEGGQRELYETLRLAQNKRVREAIAERGLARSGIVVLDALLKLRQCCCDPRLLKLPAARKVKETAKLDALCELLATLRDEGRHVLLFSQFTSMLDLIEPALDKLGIAFTRLDGDTPGEERLGIVRSFQRKEVPLMLISLKAGGVGLNLTAADTVIHYDPWWNPAVENQATDRAHRIGQDKPVFVYKLICTGTVEDKILALQQRKSALAAAVLEGGRSTAPKFSEADLVELFGPLG